MEHLEGPLGRGKKSLRRAAWRWLSTPGKVGEATNLWSCAETCQREDGSWNAMHRRSYGCTRSDLPPVTWDVAPERLCYHLGKPPDRTYRPPPEIGDWSPDSWESPLEDPADGCPGGDQSCRFVLSLMRFYRRTDSNGGRVANPLLDHCGDDLIFEAINYYEYHEDLCANARMRHDNEIRADEAKKHNGT